MYIYIRNGDLNDSFYCAELAAAYLNDEGTPASPVELWFSESNPELFDRRIDMVNPLLAQVNYPLVQGFMDGGTFVFNLPGEFTNYFPILHGLIRYLRDGGTWKLSILSATIQIIREYGNISPDTYIPSGVETWAKSIHPRLFWSMAQVRPKSVSADTDLDLVAGYCYYLYGDMSNIAGLSGITLRHYLHDRRECYHDEVVHWSAGGDYIPVIDLGRIWYRARNIRAFAVLDEIVDHVDWILR